MNISEKTEQLLEALTIEEKAALLSGKNVWETQDIPRLQIPSAVCSDGPSGVRRQAGKGDHLGLNASLPATCFPSAATVANSWDVELAEQIGTALGQEASALGVDFLLGPGLNIKRSPLCGRNFEYFSEDPYLSGKMAGGYIKGIQSQGVASCPKHFAVNSQEDRRMAMNAVIDERTLREIYLTGFEIAVKEGGAKSIMSSYNEVNGIYANENKHLLWDILRKEWGFEGIVITDWGASNDHIKGVLAGSNLEMPFPGHESALELVEACRNGKISKEEIDRRAGELLETILTLKTQQKMDGKDQAQEPAVPRSMLEEHYILAKRAAAESVVLLKNEKEILPLASEKRTAIIGDFANIARYQGAGSSNVNAAKVKSILEAVDQYPIQKAGFSQGYERGGQRNLQMEKEALAVAQESDQILYCFGLDEISEVEGMDRTHMRIPENQLALLQELSRLGKPVIGVLSGGCAVEMPWESCCDAIVHTYLGGEAGAEGVLQVLTGQVNPSGKLNETYPMNYEDTPAYGYCPAKFRDSQYRESLYVGYRYYDTAKIGVRYPFGYGLSYTTFQYSDLKVSEDQVSFVIKNTGARDGAEVAQLYVSCPEGKIFRPKKELKGFQKVYLKAGEKKTVTIPLDDKAFRYWNIKTNQWERETSEYHILVGASSRDIRLEETLLVEGTTEHLPYSRSMIESYYTGKIKHVADQEFAALMGGILPEEKKNQELTINDALCQMAEAKSSFARLVFRVLTRMKDQSQKKGTPNLNVLFIYNIPFRGIAKMTNGMVSMKMAEGMVTAVNGHFFRGLRKIIKEYFENAKANKKFEKELSELQ